MTYIVAGTVLVRRVPHLQPNCINRHQYLRRERGAKGVDVVLQLRQRRHTDDGAGHLPFGVTKRQRQLRGRQAIGTRQRVVPFGGGQRLRATPALLADGLELGTDSTHWRTGRRGKT